MFKILHALKCVVFKNLDINKKDEAKLFAFLATFLTIIGLIIVLIFKKNDDYVMFYARQGIVLFIIQIIASVVSGFPFTGWLFGPVLWILFLIVWIIAWINALSGEKRETILIGEFAGKIKI